MCTIVMPSAEEEDLHQGQMAQQQDEQIAQQELQQMQDQAAQQDL